MLTEQCEGKIARLNPETFELAFEAVEDVQGEPCAGYSGTFVQGVTGPAGLEEPAEGDAPKPAADAS